MTWFWIGYLAGGLSLWAAAAIGGRLKEGRDGAWHVGTKGRAHLGCRQDCPMCVGINQARQG